MNETPIKILLVEDNPADARLIEEMLAEATGLLCDLKWVDNLTAGIKHLEAGGIDVMLLDLGLPESSGLDTLQRLHAQVPNVPTLVVLSGLSDETIAIQAVQSGAQDYLVKDEVNSALLVRSIRYAIERSQAQEALQQAHSELERRVMERTAELANTVDALNAEIIERKQAEERIRYMAHYDALTGLANRVLLQDRVRQALAYANRNWTQVALLFIDLDSFKHINDSLGHPVGDHLLQLVAHRFQESRRQGDSVARLGGDEFVLCLPLLSGSNDAALVAQKALDMLDIPFIVEGHELHVSASIGISLYPDDGTTVESLMRAADTAMYYAKEKGRNNYQFFTPALNNAAQYRLVVANRLRNALARNEFAVYYQPQVDMASGTIFSAEALLRWQQPGQAAVSCGPYISIAEDTGLVLPIGEWVLRQACQQLKEWHNAGYPELHIAVNLSARQFYQPNFLNMIKQILDEAELPANALDLEITESLLLQRSEDNVAALNQLSSMGMQLSVDDFGTGYSSLAYLQRFPVDAIKIDQSFVRGIGRDSNHTALVAAIIAMANSLQLKVLAEGVETSQQRTFLMSHGCPSAQGYYYSEAIPAEEFSKILSQQDGRIQGKTPKASRELHH
jgi:diguanylate cyclase (GGDEF)-like protein